MSSFVAIASGTAFSEFTIKGRFPFSLHHIDGAECETVDRELADLIEKHVHIDLIPTLVRQNVVNLGDPKYPG